MAEHPHHDDPAHQGQHTHDDGMTYVDPNDMPVYNDLQKRSLEVLSAIVEDVYDVGINPDDMFEVTIIHRPTMRMRQTRIDDEGAYLWMGQPGVPAVVLGFSCIQHPGLESGEGHTLFHQMFEAALDTFTNGEITMGELIIAGRHIGKMLGLIPTTT